MKTDRGITPSQSATEPIVHGADVDVYKAISELGAALQHDERRAHPRYEFRRPVIAIPVLPDGRPDPSQSVAGESVDLSNGGIALQLESERPPNCKSLLIGMREDCGTMRYIGIQIQHSRPLDTEHLHIGGQFGGVGAEILHSGAQLPMWDPHSMRFTLQQPEEVLEDWAEAGIMRRTIIDRVQVCPRCCGLPTFRYGCRSCGSAKVANDQLIHHYACAHVGPVADFETSEGMICPKCRTRSLVVGADYEYLSGPYRCLDCQWSETELEHVAHCLRCGHRFPSAQARVEDVFGYQGNMLSVSDYLPA